MVELLLYISGIIPAFIVARKYTINTCISFEVEVDNDDYLFRYIICLFSWLSFVTVGFFILYDIYLNKRDG